MRTVLLLVRWSGRDLRRRWPVILAIALVAAIGTGVFASLNSQSAWRRASYDTSYAALRMHDLRVQISAGTVDADRLRAVVAGLPHAARVAAADVRLQVPTQVETADGKDIRTGLLVGVDLSGRGPAVDTVHPTGGRALTTADQGRPVAVFEHNYAKASGLQPGSQVRLTGRTMVAGLGTGLAPEHLLNGYPMGGFGVASQRAVLFMPLSTVQTLAGRPGQANDLLVRLRPDVDRAAVQRELWAALARDLPQVPVTVTTRDEDPTYELMYDDIDGDQRSMSALSLLVLLGATVAAFNLTNRVVQAQRREIGVQMALGLPPGRIVIRPVLFGFQIALLGVAGGVGVGLMMNSLLAGILNDAVPLPQWRTAFQPGRFAEAAAIGLLLPFLGAIIPVLRILRIQPDQAIRTGPRTRRGGRLAALGGRLALPGRTLAHLPLRRLLRTPLRPFLTAVGVGAAIATTVVMYGSVDVIDKAFARAGHELTRQTPERVTVTLDTYYPNGSTQVRGVTSATRLARAEPGLTVPVTAVAHGTRLDLSATFLDLRTAMWRPTLTATAPAGAAGGLILTEKAADDLGVRPGDSIAVRHPVRQGSSFRQADSAMTVAAVTPYPMRGTAYLDLRHSASFGLRGMSNVVQAEPSPGITVPQLRRDLLAHDGVAAVQSAAAISQDFRDTMAQYQGVLQLLQALALLLVLLIAFNAASLNADERAREHATLFAFGHLPRTALALAMAESLLIGLLGTAIGSGLGYLALHWITAIRANELPELQLQATATPGTYALALVLGVVLVTVAPVLTLRRQRRMDVPAALRVVE